MVNHSMRFTWQIHDRPLTSRRWLNAGEYIAIGLYIFLVSLQPRYSEAVSSAESIYMSVDQRTNVVLLTQKSFVQPKQAEKSM